MLSIAPAETAVAELERQLDTDAVTEPAWVLMYAVEDVPVAALVRALRRRYPAAFIFGATSFRGVFTPAGFVRGAGLLLGQRGGPTRVAVSIQRAGPAHARARAQAAASSIERELGRKPGGLRSPLPYFEYRTIAPALVPKL